MTNIGIVGGGVAGLHLGLFLRQHDIPVTIYSDKPAEQLALGRLPNTVVHQHTTLEREQQLGVDHWDPAEYGYTRHYHYVGAEQPLRFAADARGPARALDHRIYLPRLAEDFMERGGTFQSHQVQPSTVVSLSEQHDLIVVATGRGGLANMFARRADMSPFDMPQRKLCAALYDGISYSDPTGMTLSVSPQGELLELPMHSFDGPVTALLFEITPGGAMSELAELSYEQDPGQFEKRVLAMLEEFHPTVFERVDPNRFGVTRPEDVLQGALVPTVREDYVRLPNGRYALSMGDVHATVDPLIGQGANLASYSAWVIGETIVEDLGFDERLCAKIADRRANRILSTARWGNFMLRREPAAHLLELFTNMASRQDVADEFVDFFNRPERLWDVLSTPERTRRFLAEAPGGGR